jgi:Isopentenyldiphosphate isomerase
LLEYWDVYDKYGNKTGIIKTRSDVWEQGEFHLGAALWIVNNKGEILIQKRASTKRRAPDLWGNTVGSVISGETGKQGLIREVREEIGITVNEDELVFLDRHIWSNNINDNYVIIYDFPIDKVIIQPEEVSEVKWISIDEMKKLIYKGTFMMNDIKELDKIIGFIEANLQKQVYV